MQLALMASRYNHTRGILFSTTLHPMLRNAQIRCWETTCYAIVHRRPGLTGDHLKRNPRKKSNCRRSLVSGHGPGGAPRLSHLFSIWGPSSEPYPPPWCYPRAPPCDYRRHTDSTVIHVGSFSFSNYCKVPPSCRVAEREV